MSTKKNFTETQSSEMTDNIFNNSVEANSDTTVNSCATVSSRAEATAHRHQTAQVGIRGI